MSASTEHCEKLSAFVYESYNGNILEMIKSSQGVSHQIIKTVWLQMALPSFARKVMEGASKECLGLFGSFSDKKKKLQTVDRCHGVTALDRPKIRSVNHDDYLALNGIGTIARGASVRYFSRVVVNGEIIHSKNYTKTFRRNSYTVILRDWERSVFSVKTYVVCDVGQGETCYALGNYFQKEKHGICSQMKNPDYFIPVEKNLGHLTAIPASQIKAKCVFMKTKKIKVDFVFTFINHNEMLK